MISGAGPEQRDITSNEWQLDKELIPPVCAGPSDHFPTIFALLREQQPGADIAIFHHWDEFAHLVEPNAPSHMEHGKTAEETMRLAIAYLETHTPRLLFIHLDEVDDVGHEQGHMTPQYLAAIADVDRLTGELLSALDRRDLRRDTTLLLTSDHGGIGKKHGGISLAEIEIP